LKILYVIDQKPDGYPGGIEYHQLDLLQYFVKRKVPVSMVFPETDSLCLRTYNDDKVEEIRYKGGRLDDHRLKDYEIENVFGQIISDVEVDLVHFQSIRTLPLSLIEIAKNRKKKVLISLHEYYFWCINCIMLAPEFCWFEENVEKCFKCLTASNYRVHQGFMKERRQYINYLFQIVDKVIVPSFYVRDIFLGLYKSLTDEKCKVIEWGIDKDILEDIQKETNSTDGNLHLAFLGNFLHYKGNKTFLELVNYYKPSDSLNFSIIGNIFDPSIVPSYKNLHVAGGYTRDNVVKKIHQVNPDLILLLSNWPETFSYTLSEATASVVPVIATDGGALRERVSKESVGFLVPVEDPMPRTIEIIEDLRQHPEAIDFLRENVREARKRLKTTDDMAEEHLRLYSSLSYDIQSKK
jgi:glycosyltransferase involved in cell wall biosynthesis